MKTVIQVIRSEAIRFRLFDDASAEIVDLKRDRVWTMGGVALQQRRWLDEDFCRLQTSRHHPEAYAGRFRAEMEGDLARITLYAPFVGGLLDDEPRAAAKADAGSPEPASVGGTGALRYRPAGKAGWIAIIEEGEPNCHVLRKYAKTAPIWIKPLDSWEYDRRITYRFVDGRNIAFMLSKPFARAQYEEHWLDVPVDYRDTPDRLEVDFTFTQALEVVKECRKLGMAGGQFKFDGWSQGGYDARHPDIWPPDPAMGTIDEFRTLLAQGAPFMTSIHENYNDIYEASPTFPHGVARDRFNEPIPGGVWAGGLVYHDAVFGMTHMGVTGPAGEVTAQMRRRLLGIMLYGWGGTFRGFTRETWPTWKKAFPRTLFVDEWHGRVALAETTNHEYATPDGLVEPFFHVSKAVSNTGFGDRDR
ncbi:MAG: hypothetical protein ACOC2Q_01385 [Spirochaetota bacterium]